MCAKLLAPRIFRLSYGHALAAAAATFCYRLVLFIEMFVFSNENDVTISHSATKVYLLENFYVVVNEIANLLSIETKFYEFANGG